MENIKQKYKKVVKFLSILFNKSPFKDFGKKKIDFNLVGKNPFGKKAFGKVVKFLSILFNKSPFKDFGKKKIDFNPFSKANLNEKERLKVSNFNKCLIVLIGVVFIYLFYLSIPTLYKKTWVQNIIEKKLIKEFKINFSVSSEISYEILPSPHFTIKDAKIFDDNLKNPRHLSNIKELKVFISQKNLFNKNKLEINEVSIDGANISIQEIDFNYFKSYLNKIFSKKKLNIKNSNIFYKNNMGETISITKVKNFNLFWNNLKLLNQVYLKGEMFNIPFNFEFNKDLLNKKNTTLLNGKKLKFIFKNTSVKEGKITNGLNELSVLNSKFESEYKLENKSILFKSKNSQLINNNIDYKGELNLHPFHLFLDVDLDKLNLIKLLDTNSILFELIKSKKLFNENISTTITLDAPTILKNKLFDSLKMVYSQKNGLINFNQTQFITNKISTLNVMESSLNLKNDNFIFMGDFKLSIINPKKFFNFFQIPKKKRKLIKNIYFSLDYDFLRDHWTIKNFKIDDTVSLNRQQNVLSVFNNDEERQIPNLNKFRIFLNKLYGEYYDG